jgi:hypothetical protein
MGRHRPLHRPRMILQARYFLSIFYCFLHTHSFQIISRRRVFEFAGAIGNTTPDGMISNMKAVELICTRNTCSEPVFAELVQ